MAYENFSADYTEVDPSSSITVTSTKVSWTDIPHSSRPSYVKRDKGAGFFTGAYKHQFEIYHNHASPYPISMFWGLFDGVDYSEELILASNGDLELLRDNGGTETDVWTGFLQDTVYYITITRTAGGTLTAKIRTGSHTGTLRATLEVTGATTACQHIYPYNNYGNVLESYSTGYIQNLDLDAGAKFLAGTIDITSSVTGSIQRIKSLVGTVTCQSVLSGALSVNKKLTGSAAIASGVTGDLIKTSIQTLIGSITIACTTTGNLTKIVRGVGGITLLAPTNRRIIRPYDKPSFEHTQRYRLIKDHPLGPAGGLILFTPFNENSGGTVLDLSGNKQTGTLQGDAHFEVGEFGSLIDFDGTGDFISVVTNNDIGNGSYTVIARVQTGADVTSLTRVILGKRNTASSYPFEFEINKYELDKTQLGLARWDGTTSLKALSGTDAVANKDYWVAGTWDGTNLKLYVDGILKGTTDASALGDSSNADDYTIGSREKSGSELYWDGKISYVYIYNRALDASELIEVIREPYCMIQKVVPAYFFVPVSAPIIKTLAGTSVIVSDTSAEIKRTRGIAGAVVIESIVVVEIKRTRGISGAVAIESVVTAELKKLRGLAGTVAIVSTSVAEIKKLRGLTGTVAIVGTSVAEIRKLRGLTGTVAIVSTSVVEIKRTRGISGAVAIESVVTAELKKLRGLAGTVAIVGTSVAEIRKLRGLAGTVAIVSTCVAEIKRTRGIAGTVVIESIVVVEIKRTRGISGAVAIVSTSVAEIKRTRGLAGTVAILSLVTGELSDDALIKLLSGTVVIASSVVGELLSIAKGRTYFTYENDKIVFYVAGLEAVRIKQDGGIDVKGTVTENAF